MEKIAHFCQRCRAANEPGDSSCRECGTRLMIVTLPPSQKHEIENTPSYYEDHLLERVTLLEFRLTQVSEQLAMAYEFISKQADSFEKDHLKIQSFFDALIEINPEIADSLSNEFSKTYNVKNQFAKNENNQNRISDKIISNHENSNKQLFSHLVKEGISLLKENEEKQAFRTLERAALLSPTNTLLNKFIAENLFETDRFDSAKIYLKKIYETAPQDIQALLYLAVIYADEGDSTQSRKFLSVLAGNPKTMICANYVWGILAAFEGNWKESLVAFKECLENSADAEIFYLIGCGYFQINKYKSSLQFLEKAIVSDENFADAWFMKSLIYSELNKEDFALQSKQKAFEIREAGAKCLKYFRQNKLENLKTALPFIHFNDDNKRLLTNTSVRLNKFFRRLVFESLKETENNPNID